ncbi:hypothetical protein HVW49_15555 [Escherichia fergusonii]|nr:hypothetical protein HG538_16695 [Escherichia fergusonii]QLM37122.1 hypothetical protein HVV65_17225 [Escherichia fergusonii]QMA58842.1 hypothetical protein HV025_15575 [Escherichia fergusonii]QMA81323.1 hypothetical protein HV020_15575 [Escherichia fergusonii]QMA94782.1 hypothetical protein HV015_15575 [Escherichia fergusonii]
MKRAIKAGFDSIDLHSANGFLLQNFFSPLFNRHNHHSNDVCAFRWLTLAAIGKRLVMGTFS